MTVEAAYHVPYNRFVAIFAESAKHMRNYNGGNNDGAVKFIDSKRPGESVQDSGRTDTYGQGISDYDYGALRKPGGND